LRLRTIDEDVLRYQLKVGRWIREGKEWPAENGYRICVGKSHGNDRKGMEINK
jgi:hypothetical protein